MLERYNFCEPCWGWVVAQCTVARPRVQSLQASKRRQIEKEENSKTTKKRESGGVNEIKGQQQKQKT